jgi:PAS domain S-box-containing protein
LRVATELPGLMGDAEIPVAVMDETGRLTWMSPALQSLLGQSLEGFDRDELALYGQFGNVRLRREDLPLAVACKRAKAHEDVVTVTMPDGVVRHHHWRARPLSTPTGEFGGAMAVVTDITPSVEAARRRLDANLGATMCHQLRTPLTSILGHAELLQDGVLRPVDASHALATIQRAARRLEDVAAWLCDQLE